jgi:hypothetical protein
MPLNVDKISTGSLSVNGTEINKNGGLPYKVYTALLTQTGGDDPQEISSGSLTQGVTYYFTDFNIPEEPWDFSNVGGPIYPNTNSFVATNTSDPNSYGSANIGYNTGAPVATVLENTIGNIWFGYGYQGSYYVNSSNLFINNKTSVTLSPIGVASNGFVLLNVVRQSNNQLQIIARNIIPPFNGLVDNGFLSQGNLIEIRVYN